MTPNVVALRQSWGSFSLMSLFFFKSRAFARPRDNMVGNRRFGETSGIKLYLARVPSEANCVPLTGATARAS
jgi:hypothetical protein